MKVQLAVCAKDLPPAAASYQAVVVSADDQVLGSTEVVISSTSTTSSPVWNNLITCDVEEETAVVTVQIIAGHNEKEPMATATFAIKDVLGSYYHAAASFTAQDADAGAKIALHAEPVQMGAVQFQLAGSDLPDTDFGMFRKQHTDGCVEVYSAVTG